MQLLKQFSVCDILLYITMFIEKAWERLRVLMCSDIRGRDTGIRHEVIREIRELAEENDIRKVMLFGSRARGDFYKTSDIDLAVSGGDVARFALSVDEDTSTLLRYDIVDMDGSVQEELLDSIKKEGVVLYEKI